MRELPVLERGEMHLREIEKGAGAEKRLPAEKTETGQARQRAEGTLDLGEMA